MALRSSTSSSPAWAISSERRRGISSIFMVRRVKKLVPAWSFPMRCASRPLLRQGCGGHFKPVSVGPDDVAVPAIYGRHDRRCKRRDVAAQNVSPTCWSCEAWVKPALDRKPKRGQFDVSSCALPLYHIFALTVDAGCCGLRSGARNVLIPNPRDFGGMISALKPYRIHIFPGVNTLYNALTNHPRLRELDFSELAMTIGGGMAVHPRSPNAGWRSPAARSAKAMVFPKRSPAATAIQSTATSSPARSACRCRAPRSTIRDDDGKRAAARRGRRNRDPRAAGHGGLLAAGPTRPRKS